MRLSAGSQATSQARGQVSAPVQAYAKSGSGGAAILMPIGRHTDMGRCIWLHHLDLEDENDDEDDWRGAEGPTG